MNLEKPPLPPASSRQEIGRRLQLTSAAIELKATDICKAIGVQPSAWSMMKNGHSLPSPYDMIRFADIYGVTLDWIYRGDLSGVPFALADKIRKLQIKTP